MKIIYNDKIYSSVARKTKKLTVLENGLILRELTEQDFKIVNRQTKKLSTGHMTNHY